MRKIRIFIVLVVVLAAFAAADFYLNGLGAQLGLEPTPPAPQPTSNKPSEPAPVQSMFRVDQELGGFKVMRQVTVNQVFDRFDLSSVKSVRITKNYLEKAAPPPLPAEGQPVEGEPATTPEPVASEPLSLFEIQGPVGQGGLTYLAVKLAVLAQVNRTTETINEDSQFGDNSFFFNDLNNQNTGFLVSQVGDTVYAFQFSKNNSTTYEAVKGILSDLTSRK